MTPQNNNINRVRRLLLLNILLFAYLTATASNNHYLKGVVSDTDNELISFFATISLEKEGSGEIESVMSDEQGAFSFTNLEPGKYILSVTASMYEDYKTTILVDRDLVYNVRLHFLTEILNEVVVTASESKGLITASKIDSTAMRHLQPTSFSDLLELLPGGKSVDPDMGEANFIKIREAGQNDNSSLGVGFVVDGVAMSNDANLQTLSSAGTANSNRESVSKGVDMRSIPTDNIESVEVVRGIPSAEYGDLTSGLVVIKRKAESTPFTARFKSDEYSTLYSLGKGVKFSKFGDVLNIDFSYLNSKVDPRNSFENFKRASASMRWRAKRETSIGELKWTLSGDYTGSFDNAKSDKDITMLTDNYISTYDKFSAAFVSSLSFKNSNFWRKLSFILSASQELNSIEQIKNISLNKPTAIPTAWEEGENNGVFLPYTYEARVTMDGKPLYIASRLISDSRFDIGKSFHNLKMGLEWNFNNNRGRGEEYDLSRPISGLNGNISRPRPFYDIPSMQRAAFFIDEKMGVDIGEHNITTSLGVRATMPLNIDEKYAMRGKIMIDPRINVMWALPKVSGWAFDVTAGIGWLSKMPTTAQLYPNFEYEDISQINYYHLNPDLRLVNYMTYKWDKTNYDIMPAKNRKVELRLGVSRAGNNFSITLFNEAMENGFSNLSYFKSLAYKKYDVTSVDDSNLVAPPDLANVAYTNEARIFSYNTTGNDASTYKKGLEFQFTSKRIEALKTRISFNGAWLNTTYSKGGIKYEEKNIILNNNQLGYIGVYDYDEGTTYEQLTTNTILDTYLKKIDMIISASFQCTWYKNYQPLWNSGVPVGYVDKFGEYFVYQEEDKEDLALQHLVNIYSDGYFNLRNTPFAMDFNLKVTKRIGKFIDMSMFVNRLFSLYPSYYVGNQLIRRSSSPYFGMEANFKF